MSKKWEIRRVSTTERIFDKIRTEAAQPVGIVLFGADCDLKDEVYMECVEQIPNLATGYGGKTGNIALRGAKRPFTEGRSVLAVLDGDSSAQHEARHQTVTALRDLGAKTLVGIYAEARLRFFANEYERTPDVVYCQRRINNQILSIEQSNPTADGLDYFIVVEEEKEGQL